MNNKQFWSQLLLFVAMLLLLILGREYFAKQLLSNGIDSYQTHQLMSIGVNLILSLISYLFIKKNGLTQIGGLTGTLLNKWNLLLFPLIYLILLNCLFMDDLNMDLLSITNIGLLTAYVISIGISEELSIRGFIQSHLVKRFGNTEKNVRLCVIAASLFFGIIHLIKFNKGIYGELSQIFYATFIGVMFGAVLVITKRIYPLIIVHAIVDFVPKLESIGVPVRETVADPMSIENAVLSALLVSPCLIYGLYIMKKNRLVYQEVVNS